MKKRLTHIAVGLVLGLVLAEALFWLRDGGAFAHVNFYVPDAQLAVRLEPNVTQRLQLGKNPLTTAHTNSLGFRGGEWPATTGEDVIVVGDSQVFGLGVEDGETFSALLGDELKRPVLNAGVPTYGPQEYLATAAEVLKTRQAKQVLVVINVSNDFFELERPNITRHAVWDGWAVRKETAPTEEPTQFPLRHWLMSRSHAVYAARRLLASSGPVDAVESEGAWKDLVELRPGVGGAVDSRSLDKASEVLREPLPINAQSAFAPRERPVWGQGPLRGVDLERVVAGHPGDIVYSGQFEMARGVKLTAELIKLAAEQLPEARREVEELKKAAERNRLAEDAQFKQQLERATAEKQAARADVQRLRWSFAATSALPAPMQKLKGLLLDFQKRHGVEVTLVVLPLDVQVSSAEWTKYDAPELDMKGTLRLNRLLVESARDDGLRAVDLLEALQAAEPGAFLDGDLHMTAKGHRAVATALARALRGEDRLSLPSPREWDAAPLLAMTNAPGGCEARVARGWMRVFCRGAMGATPLSVALVEGDARDVSLSGPHQKAAAALMPLEPAQRYALHFDFAPSPNYPNVWAMEVRVEGPPTAPLKWTTAEPIDTDLNRYDELDRYATCGRALLADPVEGVWGDTTLSCLQSYPEECVELLACAQGHPDVRPKCANGAGRSGKCL
ncbi:MAG: hypothetical protein JNM17_34470 [Archangium sp.]|nr:hypothetical protein [Archangium sp.]